MTVAYAGLVVAFMHANTKKKMMHKISELSNVSRKLKKTDREKTPKKVCNRGFCAVSMQCFLPTMS
jgi:hypothetical protein